MKRSTLNRKKVLFYLLKMTTFLFLRKFHRQQHIRHGIRIDVVAQHPILYHQFEYLHVLTFLFWSQRHKNLCPMLMETQCVCYIALHSIMLIRSHLNDENDLKSEQNDLNGLYYTHHSNVNWIN